MLKRKPITERDDLILVGLKDKINRAIKYTGTINEWFVRYLKSCSFILTKKPIHFNEQDIFVSGDQLSNILDLNDVLNYKPNSEHGTPTRKIIKKCIGSMAVGVIKCLKASWAELDDVILPSWDKRINQTDININLYGARGIVILEDYLESTSPRELATSLIYVSSYEFATAKYLDLLISLIRDNKYSYKDEILISQIEIGDVEKFIRFLKNKVMWFKMSYTSSDEKEKEIIEPFLERNELITDKDLISSGTFWLIPQLDNNDIYQLKGRERELFLLKCKYANECFESDFPTVQLQDQIQNQMMINLSKKADELGLILIQKPIIKPIATPIISLLDKKLLRKIKKNSRMIK